MWQSKLQVRNQKNKQNKKEVKKSKENCKPTFANESADLNSIYPIYMFKIVQID